MSNAPVKRKRNARLTREQVQSQLDDIHQDLLSHVGQRALFFQKESRDMMSYLVEIVSPAGSCGVVAQHACYHPEGGIRCKINHTVDAVRLLTGEQRILFFDEVV